MLSTDVVVAGGGVSGLLIAGALASEFSVRLLEQCDSLPHNKYWLTDENSLRRNPQFEVAVDQRYDSLGFVANDGLTARIRGNYCLWDTKKLIDLLAQKFLSLGGQILTGHRLYSVSNTRDGILVRANSQTIRARLLIDCMGFGSPLVGAKDIATIKGYYILHGCEIGTQGTVQPIGLDNVVLNKHPAFFEMFPTSHGTAHVAIILPSREFKPPRSISDELSFILRKSHYCSQIKSDPLQQLKPYFGIVPVGHLHRPALDRIVFFGEAGQANPAASATGLSRMLHTYEDLASAIGLCLKGDTLGSEDLLRTIPSYMTRMNRAFQESLFESLLSFNSDDFRRLVQDMKDSPDHIVNDLLFAEFDFGSTNALRLAVDALLRPRGVLGRNIIKSVARFCSWRR